MANFTSAHPISCVRLSSDNKHFVVAFEGGSMQINNAYSGTLLYNKTEESKINLEHEVANLSFFGKQTNFWVAATLWDGRIAFLLRPGNLKGPEVVQWRKLASSHKRDVTCLDISHNNTMVTASIDNIIVFWNSYNGKESKVIYMCRDMASLKEGKSVQKVLFANPMHDDFVLVFISNGDLFVLERQSETFVTPAEPGEGHEMSFAKVPSFSVIDMADGYILAASESGKGTLHSIKVVQESVPGSTLKTRTVSIDLIRKFKLEAAAKLGAPKALISVTLQPRLNIFIVSYRDGTVGFYDLSTCEFKYHLN